MDYDQDVEATDDARAGQVGYEVSAEEPQTCDASGKADEASNNYLGSDEDNVVLNIMTEVLKIAEESIPAEANISGNRQVNQMGLKYNDHFNEINIKAAQQLTKLWGQRKQRVQKEMLNQVREMQQRAQNARVCFERTGIELSMWMQQTQMIYQRAKSQTRICNPDCSG